MLKLLHRDVWVYDAEWVPDPATGRRVYGLPADMPDSDVVAHMFVEAGATDENPRPYLKTALCRIVSIAAVKRSENSGGAKIEVVSLPRLGGGEFSEREIVGGFLNGVGQVKPQLVGFNNANADLPAILQRAAVNSVYAPKFCARPNKPWEGIDYFGKYTDWHIDLMQELGGFSKGATPSLHQIAAACGIPAKGDVSGASVLDLWTQGRVAEIVRYNIRDVFTTYLLLLRVALLSGKIKPDEFERDETTFAKTLLVLARENPVNAFMVDYVREWRPEFIQPTEEAA